MNRLEVLPDLILIFVFDIEHFQVFFFFGLTSPLVNLVKNFLFNFGFLTPRNVTHELFKEANVVGGSKENHHRAEPVSVELKVINTFAS